MLLADFTIHRNVQDQKMMPVKLAEVNHLDIKIMMPDVWPADHALTESILHRLALSKRQASDLPEWSNFLKSARASPFWRWRYAKQS